MKSLIIVAKAIAKDESINIVKNELQKLIHPTLLEEGCIAYKLSQDNDNPAIFIFYEEWASRELWQKHMQNDNLANVAKAIDGHVQDMQIFEMTNID